MFFTRLLLKIRKSKQAFQIEREKCCVFTGHRPEKLYGKEGQIIVRLRKEIEVAVAEGYTTFVTGCSRGVDLWAADIVLELQRNNKDIKLICAIPFPGFDDRWPVDWKKHLQLVRKKADHIQTIAQKYSPGIYQRRNEYMCQQASRIIAVCNGQPSGTQNTIDYANSQNIPVRLIQV